MKWFGKCVCVKDLGACDNISFKKGVVYDYTLLSDSMATGNRHFTFNIDNTYFSNTNKDNFYDYFMDVVELRERNLNTILY